jgi:hypothetical protein
VQEEFVSSLKLRRSSTGVGAERGLTLSPKAQEGLTLITTEERGVIKSRKHRDCPSQRTRVKRSTFLGFIHWEFESEDSANFPKRKVPKETRPSIVEDA